MPVSIGAEARFDGALLLHSKCTGGAIVDDLGVQRETLERSRARLQDTNAELSRGRRVLTRFAQLCASF